MILRWCWNRNAVLSFSALVFIAVLVNRADYLALDGSSGAALAANASPGGRGNGGDVKVDVVKPHQGGLERNRTLPGSVHAYESAELFAKVSGYLSKLTVDIGDRVKSGQLLAEIDSPELHRDVDRGKASVLRSLAQVGQMKARVVAAEANRVAAETSVQRAEANVNRDRAAFEFREKQFHRFKELVLSRSIDERLVDEKEDMKLGAQAALDASIAGLAEAKALVASAVADVERARADQRDAEAEVEVSRASLARSEVMAEYTRITSPYDGVITSRSKHRGDFVRSAGETAVVPLLTVERTDVVRLVMFVPDSEVPFTDPGDETSTQFEALFGHKFPGKISRIAFSEDHKTRTMRTEVDLPNDRGLLRNGMYGRTTIRLEKGNPEALTVPSNALVGPTKNHHGSVYVVHDGVAKKTDVSVSNDNGVNAEVTSGITSGDWVIVGNNNSIADGVAVEMHQLDATTSEQK